MSGAFLSLALMNKTAMNRCVQKSLQDHAFCSFGLIPRTGLTDHMVIPFLIFLRTTYYFSIEAVSFYTPTNGTQISTSSAFLIIF
jgi:hypothetical protein